MRFKKSSVLLYVFIVLLLGAAGCSKSSNAMPEDMPKDFDFSLNYGINGVGKVDTFNDIVIKDLVADGIAEARITLNEKEMKAIYEKMKAINIMGELDVGKKENCKVIPASHSKWKVAMNGKVKEIEYEESCGRPKSDVRKLMELEDYIHSAISAKEEYKKLPNPRGAYE